MVDVPLVSVVDDDECVRDALPDLLKELGYDARAFASAEEFLGSESLGETRCLILDVQLPGMSGPDLQRELRVRQRMIPIILITGHQSARASRMIGDGAIACLIKPFTNDELIKALDIVFPRDSG
jgi:FixJ family two-component response regulator